MDEKNSLFEPELILDRIFDYLGVKSKEFDKFKKLENEIVHFKKVRFSDGDKYEELKNKIDFMRQYPNYLPLIVSETEKIDYLNHIINVDSEVKFIEQLEEYLAKPDNVFTQFDWWMF